MESKQVQQILQQKAFPDSATKGQLIETHISWVILTDQFAYKIKKPLQYSFLDFSTLAQRKFYCEREVELNRRLTQNMYLAVVPICQDGSQIRIEGTSGQIIDYAVKMKRIDHSRQMNLLLEKQQVSLKHIDQLSDQLATFHKHSEVIVQTPDIGLMQADFADILNVNPFLEEHLDIAAAKKIEMAIAFSGQFLKTHGRRMLERHQMGFTIDGHGDLHSKNIILLEEPVIFDCIEFNDHFRQMDVLNELAFLCMDLDYYQREDLEAHFLSSYLPQHPCILEAGDQNIFLYYKLYRANVRLKVNALKVMQEEAVGKKKSKLPMIRSYFSLFEKYLSLLAG